MNVCVCVCVCVCLHMQSTINKKNPGLQLFFYHPTDILF